MRRKFTLECIEVNPAHVRFRVMDGQGSYCGILVMRVQDATTFVTDNWAGDVSWLGLDVILAEGAHNDKFQ